ncbi:MAG: 2-oxo-4-hydroxy-4-carboxy-5-ureidoimidazoline decarboxylase [Candidatus Limnocylindria bacterium]
MKTIAELNELDAEAFGAAMAPLFEGAPRFLAALAEARPFDAEEALFDAARATARSMALEGQVELLNAHPRIGADPATVSTLSHAEQGFDEDEPDDQAWVDDELQALNEAYEARFGFRFVVFVAGRPRADILPLLERAVAADRDEELRRGLDDVILIAADRMGTMRGPAPLREEQREAIALEVSRHLVGELDVDGLVRATHRLIEGGVESPALLALSLAGREEPAVSEAIGHLMDEIGLEGWGTRQSGQLLALHAAASILGEVSQPIDGAHRIVAVTDHSGLRELIARWEAAPDQRDAIDVLITREASDLFEEGAATS